LRGTACPLTLNTNGTITAGAEVVFNVASTNDISVTALSDTKAIVTYQDDGGSDHGCACVLNFDPGQATLTIADQGSAPTAATLLGNEDDPDTLTYDAATDTYKVAYEDQTFEEDGARTLQIAIDNVQQDPKLSKLDVQLWRNY